MLFSGLHNILRVMDFNIIFLFFNESVFFNMI